MEDSKLEEIWSSSERNSWSSSTQYKTDQLLEKAAREDSCFWYNMETEHFHAFSVRYALPFRPESLLFRLCYWPLNWYINNREEYRLADAVVPMRITHLQQLESKIDDPVSMLKSITQNINLVKNIPEKHNCWEKETDNVEKNVLYHLYGFLCKVVWKRLFAIINLLRKWSFNFLFFFFLNCRKFCNFVSDISCGIFSLQFLSETLKQPAPRQAGCVQYHWFHW